MTSNHYRAAGLLGTGVVAGAIVAATMGANAASTITTAASSVSSAAQSAAGHGHAGEAALTGTAGATARAAALKAVPGGTVLRVESDSGDAVYEAHMTKSDGTSVTVKFDKNLKVTAVEDGMGK